MLLKVLTDFIEKCFGQGNMFDQDLFLQNVFQKEFQNEILNFFVFDGLFEDDIKGSGVFVHNALDLFWLVLMLGICLAKNSHVQISNVGH